MRLSLTPWTGHRAFAPWDTRTPRLFDRFRHEMDHMFERFFEVEEDDERHLMFAPRTNVVETESGYEVTVDLPGMKPEDLNVEFKDGQLWITGERKCEEECEGKTFHRIERIYGEFRRVIPIDESIDPDKIDAEYKDGVLHIALAKDEIVQPKKITVKSELHE